MIRPPRISSGTRNPTHDAPRTTHGSSWKLPHHVVVGLGPAVAEELPCAPDVLDDVEVHLRDDELVLVLAALRQEVAVITDVDADRGVAGLEDGVAEVAGLEEELFPEAGRVRDVVLAVLAEVAAVGVDHGGGVVVHPAISRS